MLSVPVQALVGAVALVAGQRPVELPAAQALADATALLGLLEALHAVVLDRVGDVDSRKLHTLAGAPSTSSWVAAQQTSLDRGEVALARRLSGLPQLAAGLAAQTVSVEGARRVAAALVKLRRHLDRPDGLIDGQPAGPTLTAVVVDGILSVLCEAWGGLGDHDPRLVALHAQLTQIDQRPLSQLSRLEAGFLVLAGQIDPGLLPSALTRLLDALLPNALEDAAVAAHDERGFGLRRNDDGSGWTITDGHLDLECGELLHVVLTAELAVDPDNPTDTAAYTAARDSGWDPADGSIAEVQQPGCDGPRSLRQRRHDALKNALRRYLDSGIAGLRDKAAPHLAVTVSLDALDSHPGHAGQPGQPGQPGTLGPVAGSGAILPRSLVRRWACDSTLTRFVLSLGRKVIETSHTERTLKPSERRAKRLETGGRCQGAGCTRGPGHRLIPHHATPWATRQATSLDDTVLLCEQTHHQLHTGHTIGLKDGRHLGPDGWTGNSRGGSPDQTA